MCPAVPSVVKFLCVCAGLPPGHQFRPPAPSPAAPSMAFPAQESPHLSHSPVPRHLVPSHVPPQFLPHPQAAVQQQQQLRPGPVVQTPTSAAAPQNHSPQNATAPAPPQQHSPMLPTGTPVTLFQPVPQGHILTARVQGVCPPLSQQTPPLSGPQGGSPQLEAHGGVGQVAAPSSTGSRVTFQNIAPKPAPGGPAAPPTQQPAPQQQAQSVVIVSPNPQPNPAYTPAIHQIVLANPSAIPGAQTIQIAGQPGAAASPCPPPASHSQVQPSQTVSHTLSIKRHQIISQAPPPQPTSSESSLIKQLLLPKRGPSTPGGKLILPAPQVPPPSSPMAPSPQVIYQTGFSTQGPSAQPQPLSVQLLPGQLPSAVQLLPGQLISTSSPATATIIQAPAAAGQVTFTVVPSTGFTTSTAAVAAVSHGTVVPGVPPPPFSAAATAPPLAAPLRGDKIICQKEEEAKDATGLHVHERKIEVMENSSVAEGDSSNGTTSNGDVAPGAKLLNGRKCMESNLPPYHSGNSQGALNGPATESPPPNGKQALSPAPSTHPEGNHDPKNTLVNGVCDFDRSDSGDSKNIPNHISSKQYLGNGEVGPPEKSPSADLPVPSPPPLQQDTAKALQGERLANGPQAAGARPPSDLTNGPLGPGHSAPVLRQRLLPSSPPPPAVHGTSLSAVPSPANGVASEARGLKRSAENEDRSAAAASSGIPNKVGVRIITISDPNNAGSSATMVAVPAGTDPSTVAKVAIESATQRNCSPPQAAGSTVSVLSAQASSARWARSKAPVKVFSSQRGVCHPTFEPP